MWMRISPMGRSCLQRLWSPVWTSVQIRVLFEWFSVEIVFIFFLKLLGKCEGLLNNTPAHATEIPQVKNDYRDSVQRFHAECWCTLELPVNDKIVRNPRDLSTQQMVFLQLWCDGHSFLLIQAYVGTSDKNIDKMASAIGFLLQCYLLPILLVIPSSWVPACWSYFLLESMWLRQGVFLSPVLAANWIRFG